MNPLVLNFRGNCYSQLSLYREALADYREATEIFLKEPPASDSTRASVVTLKFLSLCMGPYTFVRVGSFGTTLHICPLQDLDPGLKVDQSLFAL